VTRLSLPSFVLMLAVTGCALPPPPAPAKGTAPVLDSISLRKAMERYPAIYPEFHFHAVDGNVNAIHREIISSTAPIPLNFMSDARIIISADQQKKGAVYVGGWKCGPEIYDVTLKAYLIDENGNRSNAMEYSIHCGGL
jgi:hypothetical protein